jgi:hypothetical protein
MKMHALVTLSPREQALARHQLNRKRGSLREIDESSSVLMVPKTLADKLGYFAPSTAWCNDHTALFRELPVEWVGHIFILKTPIPGVTYLVNTEGSTFCRYVVRCNVYEY